LNYSEDSIYDKKIFSKLIEKATAKAIILADLAELKLNGIVEVKEVKKSEDFFERISQMDITATFLEKNKQILENGLFYVEYSKSLLIKFEAIK
jgi:choline kinase